MNNQEILDNAPKGSTVVFNKNAITACGVPAVTELLVVLKPRSLADIKRIVELEKALHKLIDRASECDSWESFPQPWLDEAHDVIMEIK
jgi:hypothetical protein